MRFLIGGFLQAYVRFGPSYLLLGCKSFVGFMRRIGFEVAGGQLVMVSEEHARNWMLNDVAVVSLLFEKSQIFSIGTCAAYISFHGCKMVQISYEV